MKKVYFDGVLDCGAYIQNAMVVLPEDCGMAQLVREIKNLGFVSFKLDSMKRLVKC